MVLALFLSPHHLKRESDVISSLLLLRLFLLLSFNNKNPTTYHPTTKKYLIRKEKEEIGNMIVTYFSHTKIPNLFFFYSFFFALAAFIQRLALVGNVA